MQQLAYNNVLNLQNTIVNANDCSHRQGKKLGYEAVAPPIFKSAP